MSRSNFAFLYVNVEADIHDECCPYGVLQPFSISCFSYFVPCLHVLSLVTVIRTTFALTGFGLLGSHSISRTQHRYDDRGHMHVREKSSILLINVYPVRDAYLSLYEDCPDQGYAYFPTLSSTFI